MIIAVLKFWLCLVFLVYFVCCKKFKNNSSYVLMHALRKQLQYI